MANPEGDKKWYQEWWGKVLMVITAVGLLAIVV